MENKPSVKNRITTILLILAVIFVFIFVIHNCWEIHQEDIDKKNSLIDVERLNNEKN